MSHVYWQRNQSCCSWRKTDAAGGAVLGEDAAKHDAFVDAGLLDAVLGDVADAVDTLLENSEMKLALAADVVGNSLGLGLERCAILRVEDLGGPVALLARLPICTARFGRLTTC